jgi:hypothetical protein
VRDGARVTLSVAAQDHRAARGSTTAPSLRALSADARRARSSFNDQEDGGSEPRVARYLGTSDKEYREGGEGAGESTSSILNIAVSRQRDSVSDWRTMDRSPTDQRREDALPTICPSRVTAGKK